MKLFSALTVFLFAAVSVNAVEKSSVQELAERYQESKRNLVDSEAEQRRILGSLYDINRRMKRITREKGHLTDELFHVQGNVQNLAKVIANLEKQIDEQRTLLKTRLRTLYKLSGEGYLSILFSSSDSHELDKSMKFLKIMSDVDYRLIRNYQGNVVSYRIQRQKLKAQVRRLVQLEKSIKQQEGLLVEEQRAKSKIASSLENSRKTALRDIKDIRATTNSFIESEDDAETISGLLKPSFFEKKGQLTHPIDGSIVQDFGLITESDGVRLSHKGRQYRAPVGTPVSAVFEGTVAYADWVPGYGQTIILDHGDHYYTLYSHIEKFRVKNGQEVKKGQTIAEAGSTSRRYGHGMYFEIRHFSEPENPKVWISNKDVQISSNVEKSVELATSSRLGSQ